MIKSKKKTRDVTRVRKATFRMMVELKTTISLNTTMKRIIACHQVLDSVCIRSASRLFNDVVETIKGQLTNLD